MRLIKVAPIQKIKKSILNIPSPSLRIPFSHTTIPIVCTYSVKR